MSRIAIKHPKDPTRPTMIAAEKYHPDVHELWEPHTPERPVVAEEVSVDVDVDTDGEDLLPEDFPHREFVLAAGIRDLHAARVVQDWDQFKDIGQAREDDINAYLAALEADD